MKKLLLLLLIIPCLASAFVPGDGNDYFILEEKQYRIIFDKQYLNSIDRINQKIKSKIDSMSKFKKRVLNDPINIILFAPNIQISNAFATVMPFHTIGIFPSGMISLEILSESSWLDDVFEHELNHIFQLSHSNFSPMWRKIFKLPIFIFPIYLFKIFTPFPNIFLPRFILEGDAVLKESLLYNKGGRLYDGAARAFVYSQIRHYQHQTDKFMAKKLLSFSVNNPHLGNEIYLHGGYLMAMLAEKYSQDTIHSFFTPNKKKPSRKEIKNFKEEKLENKLSPSFGKIFSFKHLFPFLKDIVKVYFNHYLGEASKQGYSTSPVLFEGAKCAPFNQSKDEIFFLTSDLRSTPFLRTLDKKSKKWTHQKTDLPLGKIFKIDNEYYSRSSEYVSPNNMRYSLFSRGLRSKKDFDSKYVTDIRNENILHIDTKNNVDGFKLYLNDKFYAEVHSSALLDENGNIYYFKQKKDRRTLYKNKSPLFSYIGYYGKLLEIDSKGVVYFLGASSYGSSIYRYQAGRISRASSSDTIIQAQKINSKEFIVCEVTPYGYEYKVASQVLSNEQPVLYKYHFKKNEISLAEHDRHPSSEKITQNGAEKIQKNKEIQSMNYKPYSGLSKLRFAGGTLFGAFLGPSSAWGGSFLISDYLMHHVLQLSGVAEFKHWLYDDGFKWNNTFKLFNFDYLNKSYRLNWTLGYSFIDSNLSDLLDIQNRHSGRFSLKYPLIKEGRWFSVSSLDHYIARSKIQILKAGPNIDAYTTGKNNEIAVAFVSDLETQYQYINTYHSRLKLNMGYSQRFPFNYFHFNKNAELQLFLDHKYKSEGLYNGIKGGIIGDTMLHIGKNFYWTSSASYASSLNTHTNPATAIAYHKESSPVAFDNEVYTAHSNIVTDDTEMRSFVVGDILGFLTKKLYSAKSIGTASLGIKKMFSLGSSNLFTASFRSRYLLFENLNFHDFSLLSLPKGDALTPFNPILDELNNALYETKKEPEIDSKPAYTQWLEWSFGLEYLQLFSSNLSDLGGLMIGASFGFRTPVKFWKPHPDEEEMSDQVCSKSDFGGTVCYGKDYYERVIKKTPPKPSSPIKSSLKIIDPAFQLYIKKHF